MKTPNELPRYFNNAELRVVDGPDGKPRIVGYAAVFNSRSHDLGGFREEIAPGAFGEAIATNGEVLALVDHDPAMVLGRRSKGTLTMREDTRGLYVEIDPPDTTVGRDAVENIRRGDKNGMSFRFPKGAEDSWRKEGGENIRTLHKVGLLEVTVTGIPAYPATTAAVRSGWDVNAAELRTYYGAKIAGLEQKPAGTPARNVNEKRLRLLRGDQRYYDGFAPDPADACRSVLYACRFAFDAAQKAMDVMGEVGTPTDDAAVRARTDAADEAEKCVARLQEFIARCRGGESADEEAEGEAEPEPQGTEAESGAPSDTSEAAAE